VDLPLYDKMGEDDDAVEAMTTERIIGDNRPSDPPQGGSRNSAPGECPLWSSLNHVDRSMPSLAHMSGWDGPGLNRRDDHPARATAATSLKTTRGKAKVDPLHAGQVPPWRAHCGRSGTRHLHHRTSTKLVPIWGRVSRREAEFPSGPSLSLDGVTRQRQAKGTDSYDRPSRIHFYRGVEECGHGERMACRDEEVPHGWSVADEIVREARCPTSREADRPTNSPPGRP